MERQKIINDLQEWQSKDEEKRAFILIISEQIDGDNIKSKLSTYGPKPMLCISLAKAIERTKLFRDAVRSMLIGSILKEEEEEEEEETDKDTNADIN